MLFFFSWWIFEILGGSSRFLEAEFLKVVILGSRITDIVCGKYRQFWTYDNILVNITIIVFEFREIQQKKYL